MFVTFSSYEKTKIKETYMLKHKEVEIKQTVNFDIIHCDFCDAVSVQQPHTIGSFNKNDVHVNTVPFDWIARCNLCGKDVCSNHGYCDGCEDAFLCHECSETHYIDNSEGVGIINKNTGKSVKWDCSY